MPAMRKEIARDSNAKIETLHAEGRFFKVTTGEREFELVESKSFLGRNK